MTTPSVTTRTGSQQAVIARRPSPWAYIRYLAVDDKNINELYRLVSKYSQKTLLQAHKDKVALHDNAQWQAEGIVSQIGYELLEAEYDYTNNKRQKPIFASYANRIKMAGRFIQSDIVP